MWYWEAPDWNPAAITRAVIEAHSAGRVQFKEWAWPPLPAYNGYPHEMRMRAWQIQWAAIVAKLFVKPSQCSVCLGHFGWAIELHNEDYSEPFKCFPVCKACHRSLHKRFKQPAQWLQRVAMNRRPGAWFVDLPMEEGGPIHGMVYQREVSAPAQSGGGRIRSRVGTTTVVPVRYRSRG
jgi:hypothetical protein